MDAPEKEQLDRIEAKLDQVLAFQKTLEPHLPLLAQATKLLHNPALRWRIK